MDRLKAALVAVTQHRIREAIVVVLAGGAGLGYGLTLILFPGRHATPTLAYAYGGGAGPQVWGLILMLAGGAACLAVPWHRRGAPAVPLALLALAFGTLTWFILQGALNGGVPAAVWVYLTFAAMAMLLSASYVIQEYLERTEGRASLAARWGPTGAHSG